MIHPALRFCSNCAGQLEVRYPSDDNRPRHVCTQCGAVHYRNPRLVVGTLCSWEGSILLCRRAIEPRHGCWTLPAGFHELWETTQEGALRETREEAGAHARIGPLYSMIDVLPAEQVHLFYRAELSSDALQPGPESLEARFFPLDEIPWEQLAFRTVSQTLRWFVEDQKAGRFELHTASFGESRSTVDPVTASTMRDHSAVFPTPGARPHP